MQNETDLLVKSVPCHSIFVCAHQWISTLWEAVLLSMALYVPRGPGVTLDVCTEGPVGAESARGLSGQLTPGGLGAFTL